MLYGWRAWKAFPWDANDGLHAWGSSTTSLEAKSMALADGGARLAGQLCAELLGVGDAVTD